MGCCNIKGLPGMNDNAKKFGLTQEPIESLDYDDMFINNKIQSYKSKKGFKTTDRKTQSKSANKMMNSTSISNSTNQNKNAPEIPEQENPKNFFKNPLITPEDEDNLMSNRDLVFKLRDSDTRKSYMNLRTKKTDISAFSAINKAVKQKKSDYDDEGNFFSIKIKLDILNLTFPSFFSVFCFDFQNDIQPEISIELKEFQKIFKSFKFTDAPTTPNANENENGEKHIFNGSINVENGFNTPNKLRKSTSINYKNEKKSKNLKYFFEKEYFEAKSELKNLKNSYICIYLYAKNIKNDAYTYLIGEAFLPVDFLIFNFDFFENNLEIPLINKTENLTLGYLNIDLSTIDSKFNHSGKIDKDTSKKLFDNYFKLQCFTIDFYEHLGIENTELNFNFYTFNNTKLKINTYIKNYGEGLNKKDIVKNLKNFLKERDLNKTRDLIVEKYQNSINDNNENNEKEEEDRYLQMDKISLIKYYCLLYNVNEYLCDILNQQHEKKNYKNELEFLNEKIIIGPFMKIYQMDIDTDNEFDIMLLTNIFQTFLVNLHKSNSINADSIYADCMFLLRDLGSLFSKSKIFLSRINKENSKNLKKLNNTLSSINPYLTEGFKSQVYYNLILENIYKFLYIINCTVDLYIKQLKTDYSKKNFEVKAGNRLESLKSNFEKLFINTNTLFTNDIFICNSVVIMYLKVIKYGKMYSSRYNFSKNECYLNFLIEEGGINSDWFPQVFHKFYNSHILFKSFIELSEIVTKNSSLISKHNFIKFFNFNIIFQRFNIEAKLIESKKFPFWNTYLNFLCNIISSLKSDNTKMVDFISFKYNDFISHYSGLLTIVSNYPYFKILSSSDIAFDIENLTINRISNSEASGGKSPTNLADYNINTTISNNFVGSNKRFLGSYISLLIMTSFIEIFHEFVLRKYLMNIFIEKNKKTLTNISDKIFFLIFYYVDIFDDLHKNEIKITLFNLYSKIVKILFTFQFKYKFDVMALFKQSLLNIFQRDFPEITEKIYLNKLLDKLNEYKADNKDIVQFKEMIELMRNRK